MAGTLRIVPARAEHLPGILAIEEASFSLPWTAEQLETQLDAKRHVFLAALAGETVAGYIGLQFVLDEGYVSNVAVRPDCRGRGVGSALVAELLRRCRERELAFVTLEVRESNAAARALYEKHGFRAVGIRPGYYERPREDAVLMTHFFAENHGERE